MDPNEIDVLSRSTGNEIIDSHNIAIGGVLAEHDLANNFVISIDCIKKILALSIGFGFSDSWTYDNGTITSDDEYVGEHAKVGRGHSQYSQGSLVLSYTPVKYATVSFGMISTQPWKTADNKTIRFPNDVIEAVERAISGRNCTFSAFVVAATRAALDDLEEEGQ